MQKIDGRMTAFARVTSHLLLRIHYILSLHPAFFADGAIDSGETLLTVASCLSTTIIAPTRCVQLLAVLPLGSPPHSQVALSALDVQGAQNAIRLAWCSFP